MGGQICSSEWMELSFSVGVLCPSSSVSASDSAESSSTSISCVSSVMDVVVVVLDVVVVLVSPSFATGEVNKNFVLE